MKTQIDLKSALCGLIIGALAMFALGASDSTGTFGGRYQIVAFNAAGMEPNAMVIDTQTGKVWGAKLNSNWRDDGANFWNTKNQ